MAEKRTIACLWAIDKTGGHGPQFVAAVAEGLRDAWYEESERLRRAAQEWFLDFCDDDAENWTFQVHYSRIDVVEPVAPLGEERSA